MPFHFYFNLKEEFDWIPKNLIINKLLTPKTLSVITKRLENLRIKDLTVLSKLAKHPYRFQRAMAYVAFDNPGEDVPLPDYNEPPTLILDYQKWKSSQSSLTANDQSYFVIKENFLREFVKELDDKGLYLIVKFGCDSEGENLSILLGGMAKGYPVKMSDSYIECNSSTNPPTIKQLFSDATAKRNFDDKINNFKARLVSGVPEEVGVAHNTKTILGAANGKGFLEYYLKEKFDKDDTNDENIYIHPAWDSNHQNNFTVVFAGVTDLTNKGDWPINRVYDYGQACCPPQ